MPPSEMSKLRQWYCCCMPSRSYHSCIRTLIGTRTQRRCIGHRCALRRSEIFTHVSSAEDWHCLTRIVPSADLRFHDEGILSTRLRIVLRLCDGVSSQSLWQKREVSAKISFCPRIKFYVTGATESTAISPSSF